MSLGLDYEINSPDDWYYDMEAIASKPTTPEPGIYEGVDFDEYRSWDCINNSSLTPLLKSPAHYKAAKQAEDSDKDCFRFGRFLHGSALEPREINRHFVVMPDLTSGIESVRPRATNEYKRRVKEFEQSIGDKQIVPDDWFQDVQCMLHSLWRHQLAGEYLNHDGPAEVSVVWDDPETGVRCKARFDKWNQVDGIVADIKSCLDVCDFNRSIGKFRYHRQAAFYADAASVLTGKPHQFALIAVEKSDPYSVRAGILGDDSMSAGRREYRQCLRQIAECRRTGRWPGPEDPSHWHAPNWATVDDEPVQLTVGGKKVLI